MKIRERSDGYWELYVATIAGKRQRQVFKTEGAAKAAMSQLSMDRARFGRAALSMTREDREEWIRCQDRLRPLGVTVTQVVNEYCGQHQVTGKVTIEDAVAQFVALKRRAGRRPSYTRTLDVRLGLFAKALKGQLIRAITPEQVWQQINANTTNLSTMRSRRCVYNALFVWALKRNLIPYNPIDRVESISADDKPPAVFSASESAKVMSECRNRHPSLVPYIALCLFCGLRPSEAEAVAWADVDMERGLVNVAGHKAKTRKRRVVNISPNALEWMRLGGDLPPKRLSRIRSLRRAVGRWGADILRHTAASMMLQRDQDAGKVSMQLGNTPQILFSHYRELVTAEDCAAFWAIKP